MDRAELPATKTEAIRRAVEALGYHASVDQILEYVRDHFETPPPEGRPRADADAPSKSARRGKR